jgi:hypothetical protein
VVSLHLAGDAVPLASLCPTAPVALCDLIHLMLLTAPTARPTATEVRIVMQQIAAELVGADVNDDEYESYAVTMGQLLELAPTEEHVVEAPLIRRPRWTPEIATAVPPHVVVSGVILRGR